MTHEAIILAVVLVVIASIPTAVFAATLLIINLGASCAA